VAEVIPGIGTAWTPNELFTVFAGAHRGFAPPRTKDALIYENPTLAPNEQVPALASLQLDAERSWNYEVGTRATPLSFLSIELTAFALDFSNQIIEPSLSAGSVSEAALANQGRTKHRGIETGMSLDVGKLLHAPLSVVAAASYTLVDAKFDGDRLMQNAEGDTLNVAGNRLPYAPRSTAHASLTLDHPGGLLLRIDGSYVGEQYSDNFETREGTANGRVGLIQAYRLLDVSARYRTPLLGGVTLLGSVKNAADARYIASRRPEGIKVGLPRLVTLGARVDF
jgi:Fe(3+) dicitrate transport protein